jgi:hypothetical protein
MLASFTYVGACEGNPLCGPLFQPAWLMQIDD